MGSHTKKASSKEIQMKVALFLCLFTTVLGSLGSVQNEPIKRCRITRGNELRHRTHIAERVVGKVGTYMRGWKQVILSACVCGAPFLASVSTSDQYVRKYTIYTIREATITLVLYK